MFRSNSVMWNSSIFGFVASDLFSFVLRHHMAGWTTLISRTRIDAQRWQRPKLEKNSHRFDAALLRWTNWMNHLTKMFRAFCWETGTRLTEAVASSHHCFAQRIPNGPMKREMTRCRVDACVSRPTATGALCVSRFIRLVRFDSITIFWVRKQMDIRIERTNWYSFHIQHSACSKSNSYFIFSRTLAVAGAPSPFRRFAFLLHGNLGTIYLCHDHQFAVAWINCAKWEKWMQITWKRASKK